ncbi:hypothetical protein GN956_G16611 [Arapaima gigas]
MSHKKRFEPHTAQWQDSSHHFCHVTFNFLLQFTPAVLSASECHTALCRGGQCLTAVSQPPSVQVLHVDQLLWTTAVIPMSYTNLQNSTCSQEE